MPKIRFFAAVGALALLVAPVWAAPVATSPAIPTASTAVRSPTLDTIRAAGKLDCAVVAPQDDWNGQDLHGDLSTFETEICRALAVAIFGDPGKVTIHIMPGESEAAGALRFGQVQLAVGLSPSTEVAVAQGIAFGRPVFFDTQRILTHKDSGIHDVAGLRDRLVCAMDLLPPEITLQEELRARNIRFGLQSHSEQGEMDAAIAVRRCAAGTGMETRLAQSRANFHARTADFVFLPERWVISPMVVATRFGDPLWSIAANDMVDALIEAEALGITQANVAQAAAREDMRARRLLGRDIAISRALGLPRDWGTREIVAVGNFGEMFDRTVARPYRLERGLNALWTEGGLMFPMPLH